MQGLYRHHYLTQLRVRCIRMLVFGNRNSVERISGRCVRAEYVCTTQKLCPFPPCKSLPPPPAPSTPFGSAAGRRCPPERNTSGSGALVQGHGAWAVRLLVRIVAATVSTQTAAPARGGWRRRWVPAGKKGSPHVFCFNLTRFFDLVVQVIYASNNQQWPDFRCSF